jgi:hypothetical protein
MIETLRKLFALSEERLPLHDQEDVASAFADPEGHPASLNWFGDRLQALLIVPERTGVVVADVRKAARAFALENAIGQSTQNWEAPLSAIANCLAVGQHLRPFDDPAWQEAIDLGRAIAVLGLLPYENARVTAVALAGQSLCRQRYQLVVDGAELTFAEGEIERVTTRIRALFAELGSIDCLSNLFRMLREFYPYDFEMYLVARRYGPSLGKRLPSIPFGFLINLAAAAPVPMSPSAEPERKWKEAIELARDLASALDVEPFTGFAHIGTATRQIEAALRELALFDHLFLLRQWRLSLTPEVLVRFFDADHHDVFQQKLGWTPADAADLCRATTHFATCDPNLITRSALRQAGIQAALLNRMLPYFVHPDRTVNTAYISPYAAQKADLMFKPLIALGDNHLLLPAASLMGPAFYEATIAALRVNIAAAAIEKLQGDGTERVVLSLFDRVGLRPTFVAVLYNLGLNNAGECDLVFESDTDILLVECKAKALTRGSMAGVQGDALLDFAAGTLAAHAQALRHERILRSRGHIAFETGARLELKDRRITRLSITLLDHGALQDRMTLMNLFEALLGASFNATPGYKKTGQVDALNASLDDLRSGVQQLNNLGQSVNTLRLNGVSLSVGQLDVMLEGVNGLDHFRRRIAQPVTAMTLNPLFEYHYRRQKGMVN